MKKSLILTISVVALCGLMHATDGLAEQQLPERYRVAQYSLTTAQEMQQKQKRCLPGSYFGQIAPDRDVYYLNCEGRSLYGRIDASGHGRLVDEAGTVVIVSPSNTGTK